MLCLAVRLIELSWLTRSWSKIGRLGGNFGQDARPLLDGHVAVNILRWIEGFDNVSILDAGWKSPGYGNLVRSALRSNSGISSFP